jgi:capreomycidine synthase
LRPLLFADSMSFGGIGLREALAERFLAGDVSRTMATHGSTEANFLLSHALLSPGDEIIVSDPLYPQLSAVAQSIGCELRRWSLSFDRGYRPDFDELRGLLNPKTRMVVLNFPHNPTGISLTQDEGRRVREAVAQVGAYLVWDCAFTELTYGEPPISQLTLLEYERCITMGTLSKAYGLPGLRVGWCLAAPEILASMVQVRDYVTLHLSPLVEWIAERVMRSADLLVDRRLAQAKHNLTLVAAWVEAHRDAVVWVPPQGGVTAFPRLRLADSEPLCRHLAEKQGVLLVPGNCFGRPEHVRLGFGSSTAHLEEGLQRLSRSLSEFIAGPAAYNAGTDSLWHPAKNEEFHDAIDS